MITLAMITSTNQLLFQQIIRLYIWCQTTLTTREEKKDVSTKRGKERLGAKTSFTWTIFYLIDKLHNNDG